MTRDDVIDVLSAVAAGDNRTTGNTDVDLWYAVINELDRDLATRAVIEHRRECPGVWLEPGHVYQRVRAMLRDRLERESDAEREARQAAIDSRIAERVDALAEAKSIAGDDVKYHRPEHGPHDPKRVPCTYCRAGVGQPCIANSTHKPMSKGHRYHPSRIDDARRRSAEASQ